MQLKSTVAAALACICAVLPAQAAAPAFKSLSYDITLTPDFATGTVSGVEYLRFESPSDGLDAVSFSANALAVNAALDGGGNATVTTEGNRRVFHLPRRLRKERTPLWR